MPEINWSSFELRIQINASVATLYHAWATQQGMEQWFLRECRYERNGVLLNGQTPAGAGDTYLWRWHGWADDVQESGMIREANGHDRFAFSFGAAGIVEVQLEQGDIPMVILVQHSIPDDEAGSMTWHVGCKTGWTFYLTNMKAVLEHGVDLRNRETGIPNVVNG